MAIDARGFTVTLRTGAAAEALPFYEMLLGRGPDFSPHDDFHEWELAPRATLQIATDFDDPRPSTTRVRFDVSDINAAGDALAQLGIAVTNAITLPGVVSILNFDDPWGNVLGAYQELAPSTEAPQPGGSAKDPGNFVQTPPPDPI